MSCYGRAYRHISLISAPRQISSAWWINFIFKLIHWNIRFSLFFCCQRKRPFFFLQITLFQINSLIPPWWSKKCQLKTQEYSLFYFTCRKYHHFYMILYFYMTDKVIWYLQTKLNFADKIMSKPELLAPHPLNTTVNAGETASLQCKINSEMQPHIQVTR